MYSNLATVAESSSVVLEQQDMYSNRATVAVSRSVMLKQTRHA